MGSLAMRQDLEEKKRHGSAGFPFQSYRASALNGHEIFVACHWHESQEIVYIRSGSIQLIVEGQRYDAEEGEIWFFNPGELHQINGYSPMCSYTSFVYSPDILGNRNGDLVGTAFLEPMRDKWKYPRKICSGEDGYEELKDICLDLDSVYLKKHPGWQLRICSDLYRLTANMVQYQRFLLKEQQPELEHTAAADRTRELLEYIDAHYNEKITLDDAAAILRVTPKYFCAYFKSNFYMSFVSYLIRYRIDKACMLLQTTDQSVTDIALSCGFENISYFIRKFRAIEGCSPKEYRRKVKTAVI